MNKILLKSTMLMVATLGGTLMAVTVNAATQTTTSNITFTNGGLGIAHAPKSISFGKHAITGQDQVFGEVDTTQGKETNSSMTVGDYTGQVTKGWTLTAKLQTADFNGLELSINPEGTEATTGYATFTNQTLNGSEKPISSVTNDKMSLEKPETQFNLGAKIHVPANIHLDAKAYSNTIDWNLQNAPQ